MLTIITGLPPQVLGIRASGEVTRQDMETVLLPALMKWRSKTVD